MLLLLLMLLMAGQVPAQYSGAHEEDQPGELECALRVLAFNYSQTLLPRSAADRAAQQDADVAAALRLGSDCNITAPLGTVKTTASSSADARPAGAGSCMLFVAKVGSDSSGVGTKEQPFASLARAQTALRTARSSTAEHCTIHVGAGTYYLAGTLTLGSDDSNTTWVAEDGVDVTLSGGIEILASSFKPTSSSTFAADVSALNLSTITPRGSTGGPANRLFVDDMPMIWARYPDVPPHLPECALKIPIGRVGLSMPPRVGFMPPKGTAKGFISTDKAWRGSCGLVANHSWMIPTIGAYMCTVCSGQSLPVHPTRGGLLASVCSSSRVAPPVYGHSRGAPTVKLTAQQAWRLVRPLRTVS